MISFLQNVYLQPGMVLGGIFWFLMRFISMYGQDTGHGMLYILVGTLILQILIYRVPYDDDFTQIRCISKFAKLLRGSGLQPQDGPVLISRICFIFHNNYSMPPHAVYFHSMLSPEMKH